MRQKNKNNKRNRFLNNNQRNNYNFRSCSNCAKLFLNNEPHFCGRGRKKIKRCLNSQKLKANFFKPNGYSLQDLEIIQLEADELEALRLKNIENLEQIPAAEKMNISQSTFTRILNSAYQKISVALIEGQVLQINN